MPDFILDVHGLEKTLKTPDGVIDAVNGVSFGLAEDKILSAVGESGNPGLTTGVIGVKDDRIMFHVTKAERSLFKSA